MLDSVFVSSTVLNFLVDVLYVLVALFIGLAAYSYFERRLFCDVDLGKELKKGNVAVALFASAPLIFIAYIIGEILR